jgi:flavin-dependent dehydrogenase
MQSSPSCRTPASRPRPRRWDAIVVGAGFAGLSAAEAAARAGLRVLVLERRSRPGERTQTTGLLCPDSLDALAPPPRILGPRRDALRLVGPDLGRGVRVERAGAGFTPTDTPRLLEVLAERASAAGAELRLGAAVRGARALGAGVEVLAGGEWLRAARLVGADGARSTVAGGLGLPAERRLLVGVERHFDAVGGELAEDEALIVLHGRWAPGYATWAVRGFDGRLQVGLLGRPGPGFHPSRALDEACRALERRRGLRLGAAHEVRAGWVPVGGARQRAIVGSAVLVGDAAGHVSALTAGGIGRAADAGAALGERLGEGPSAWEQELRRARLVAELAGLRPFAPLLRELAFARRPFPPRGVAPASPT